MSLKPLKKTDMNKSWMKKRRDKQIKIQPEYGPMSIHWTQKVELFYAASIASSSTC